MIKQILLFYLIIFTSCVGYGQQLLNDALQYQKKGDFKRSNQLLSRLLSDAQQATDSLKLFNVIGANYLYQDKLDSSEIYYKEAAKIDLQHLELVDSVYASFLRNYSLLKYKQHPDSGHLFLSMAMEAFADKKLQDHTQVKRELLCSKYLFLGWQGEYEKAEKVVRQIIQLNPKFSYPKFEADRMSDYAFIHEWRGRKDSAVFYWNKAIAMYQNLDDEKYSNDIALCYHNVSFLEKDPNKAVDFSLKAAEYWKKSEKVEAYYLCRLYNNLGGIFSRIGNSIGAETAFRMAYLSACQGDSRTDELAYFYKWYQYLIDLDKQTQIHEIEPEIEKLIQSIEEPYNVKRLYYMEKALNCLEVNLVHPAEMAKEPISSCLEAKKYLLKANDYARENQGRSDDLVDVYIMLLDYYISDMDSSKFDALINFTVEEANQYRWYAHINLAKLYEFRNAPEKAFQHINLAFKEKFNSTQPTADMEVSRLNLFMFSQYVIMAHKSGNFDEQLETEYFEYVKGFFQKNAVNGAEVLELLQRYIEYFLPVWVKNKFDINQILEKLYIYKARKVLYHHEANAKVNGLLKEIRRLRSQIKRKSSDAEQKLAQLMELNTELLKASHFRKDTFVQEKIELAEGYCYIDCFEGVDSIHILYYDSLQIRALKSIPMDSFKHWVVQWRKSTIDSKAFDFDRDKQKEDFYKYSTKLYRKLVNPYRRHFDQQPIVVVADAWSAHLPWHLLISGGNKNDDYANYNYLFKNVELVYRPIPNQRGSDESKGQMLIVAPKYKSDDVVAPELYAYRELDSEWEELPGAENEVLRLQKRFSSTLLRGDEANILNYKEIHKDYKVLHFAMHGSLDGEEPEFSSLVMAKDSVYNGYLDINLISSMDFHADLAVLSACNTGFNEKLVQGAGSQSIGRALYKSGVDNVLMSLWKSSDDFSPIFMERFYKFLNKGHSLGESVRRTQKSILNDSSLAQYHHPLYWGTFIPYGDNAHIEISQKRNHLIFYVVAVLVLLAVIFVYFEDQRMRIGKGKPRKKPKNFDNYSRNSI